MWSVCEAEFQFRGVSERLIEQSDGPGGKTVPYCGGASRNVPVMAAGCQECKQMMAGVSGVFTDVGSSPQTAPAVNLLQGWKLEPRDALAAGDEPLQRFLVC